MIKAFYYILFTAVFNYSSLNAQDFYWVKSVGSISGDQSQDMCIDKAGLSIYSVSYYTGLINYNGKTISNYGSNTTKLLLQKHDINGNEIWSKGFQGNANQFKITSNGNRLFVGGTFYDSLQFGSNKIYKTNTGSYATFLACFDTSGNCINIMNIDAAITCKKILADENNNIYFVGMPSGVGLVYYGSCLINTAFVLKLNSNLQYINCISKLGYSIINNAAIYKGKIFIIGNTQIPFPARICGNVKTIDTSLNNLKSINFGIPDYSLASTLGWGVSPTDTDEFVVTGNYYHPGPYGKISFGSINFYQPGNYLYLARFKDNGLCKWAKNIKLVSGGQYFDLKNDRNKYFYASGGGISQGVVGIKTTGSGSIPITKFDSLGNILWFYRTSDGLANNMVNSIAVDSSGSAYLHGYYSATARFGSDSITSNGNVDIFIAKITDITLTKLPLSQSRYCTGDSIYIPYTLTGKYRAGNKFTAELSDTAGNFDTLTTNLGFRLDTLAGTIACKIPNTVLNSTQYRIRVYSDSPGVLSFYDTTHYSIYQTPLLKTINDTLLCYGQKIVLGNSGTAVSYKWFPKTAVDDSTNLFAKNTVKQTTQLVLEGYNNYCPAYDTLNLSFRNPLKVSSTVHDTLYCYNDSLSVPVTFFGGDSLQRKLLWFNTDNLFFSDSSNAVRVSNNIVKKILSNTDTSNIKIVLTDGCSEQDSVQFLYRLRKPLSVQLPTDITVCKGASVVLKIQNYKADSAAYSFRWKDAATQTLLSASDSLLKSYNQTQKIKIESKFVCNSTPDSGFVNISVLPPLQVLVNNDTTLCYGRTLLLKAVANGGNIPNQQFNWLDLTDNLSLAINTDTFTHTALKTKKIAVELYDNCSIGNDFDTILITVLPRLQAQIVKDTNVCEGKQTVICSKANGGMSNQYVYEWADLNSLILSTDSFLMLSNAQQLFYTLSLKDNCSLPLIISDTFAPLSSPKAIFTIDTVFCEKQLLNIQNTSNYQSGSVFSWNFGNGIKQQIFEPNYFYIDSGLYKITLTIQQKNACADSLSINNIQINPKPQAQFTANKTTADLSQAQFQFINQSAKASTFLWDFGDGGTSVNDNPSHTFIDFGKYDVKLIAINIYGCSDTLLKKQFIEVLNEYKIYLPTAFSPNADNLNDAFKPIGYGFKDYEITIFDRWGVEVFSSSPVQKEFIGNDFKDNLLPSETYSYVMSVFANDGRVKYYKGTIILVR